jgi:hypothetical protein
VIITGSRYNLEMEIIRLDFKTGIEALLREKPIKAIFLGTRIGDPNAVHILTNPSLQGWPGGVCTKLSRLAPLHACESYTELVIQVISTYHAQLLG